MSLDNKDVESYFRRGSNSVVTEQEAIIASSTEVVNNTERIGATEKRLEETKIKGQEQAKDLQSLHEKDEYLESNKFGLRNMSVFTVTGKWTKPEWCKKVRVRAVGGGGGGCGYSEGGGAGGYVEALIDVKDLSEVNVTVGGGGTQCDYYRVADNGSASSFGTFVTANGGFGANRNYGHHGGTGGDYAIASGINGFGSNGGGGSSHNNSDQTQSGMPSASGYFGNGYTAHKTENGGNLGRTSFGGGGVGSGEDNGGSDGGPGIVIVEEYE